MPTVPRMFEAAPVKFKQAGGLKPAALEKLEELEELVSKKQVCFWLSCFGIYVTCVFSVTPSKTMWRARLVRNAAETPVGKSATLLQTSIA